MDELAAKILAGHPVHMHVKQVEHEHCGTEPWCAHCPFQGILYGEDALCHRGVAWNELLERNTLRPVKHLLGP